jgi:hypothetical protein
MDRAFIQKLIWTVLAIGVYVLTVFVPEVGSDLKLLAGLIVGAVWVARPGDAKLIEVARKSIAPVAIALPLMFLLGGCASWGDVKPVARDVNNIARDLCEATMGSEAQRQGIGVKELCAISYIIAPFLEAPHLASANAVLGRELETPRCAP